MLNHQINIQKILIPFLLILLSFFCFPKQKIEIKSELIQKYQTQIELIDLDNTLVFKIDDLNDVIWSKFLGQNEKIDNQLKKKIKKILYKVYPSDEYTVRIQKQLKHPFLKDYGFYFVDSFFSSRIGSRPEFTLVVNRNYKKAYSFQHYEGEKADLIFDGIKKTDIKNFNKILKNEKLRVATVDQAFDICVFFVNVAYESMLGKIMFNMENVNKKYINKIKSKFKPPSFIEYKEKYKINFFFERLGYSFSQWEFDILKNGRINLVFMKEI